MVPTCHDRVSYSAGGSAAPLPPVQLGRFVRGAIIRTKHAPCGTCTWRVFWFYRRVFLRPGVVHHCVFLGLQHRGIRGVTLEVSGYVYGHDLLISMQKHYHRVQSCPKPSFVCAMPDSIVFPSLCKYPFFFLSERFYARLSPKRTPRCM